MHCPDDETVAALIEGRLQGDALRALTEHVDQCPSCRELVADAVRAVDVSGGKDEPTAGLPLPRGARVGRYVVQGCIGSGAMGIVYTARDPELGRDIALKLLRAREVATLSSSSSRGRLLREAQAMAKLAHPNVITVHDVGTLGDEVFVAMELVEGGTLGEWLRAPRSRREVVDVMRRAAEGLAAAHAAGLVHRDFKPDNVLVGRDGRVRVTDFGLARLAPSTTAAIAPPEDAPATDHSPLAATQTGTLAGTPAYMAPEVIAGKPADVRSDVFAFCVTFYEALYGERPFAGKTLAELRTNIEARHIRTPSGRARVPAWLRRVVVQGLDALPDNRPQNMRALLDGLDAGPRRSLLRVALISAGAMALLAAGALAASRESPGNAATPTGAGAPGGATSATATAVTDVPLPQSSSVDAQRAYARGLQAMRDGTWGADDFEQAARLDPSMAAAHLRYAMLEFWQLPTQARAHLAKAVEARSTLTARDQDILRAAQAWMQSDPADDRAYARLLAEALARHPGDAEIAYYAGFALTELADHAQAITRLRSATELDPGFAAAYQLEADEQAYAGDFDGAVATIETCIARAPEATRCLMERTFIDEAEGNCTRLEQDGRRIQAHDPESDMSYGMLASAAYAQGKPLEAVRELLRQQEAHVAPPMRRRAALIDAFDLAALTGDFAGARTLADTIVEEAGTSPDRSLRSRATLLSIAASLEAGQPQDAARAARTFLERQDAWTPEPRSDDFAVLRDGTPGMWIGERAGGSLSTAELHAQLDTWTTEWAARLPEPSRGYAWLYGYARFAATPEDAHAALEALPRFGDIPRFTPLAFGDAYVGRTYVLAGRDGEAIPHLQRAARSCLALGHPIDHTQTELLLGQALAEAGDVEGACAAYGVVLSRWGHAKPRSVTADAARRQATVLGCR
ncbi:MAG TPA: protein kinase [Polyangiaceae bacterium]